MIELFNNNLSSELFGEKLTMINTVELIKIFRFLKIFGTIFLLIGFYGPQALESFLLSLPGPFGLSNYYVFMIAGTIICFSGYFLESRAMHLKE